jgi:hypothetical protein
MKRMSNWTSITLTAAALACGLAACGDETVSPGTDTTPTDTIFPDVPPGDTTDTVGPDTNVPTAVKVLDFEQAYGDDQRPCKNQPRCTIYINYTDPKTLKVVYTEDGVPVAGQPVRFEVSDPTIGHINTASGATDPTGIASVVTKSRVPAIGQYTVKAYIDGVGQKFFDVVVSPKGQVPLTVIGTYNGTRPVSVYSVNLYKQNGAGQPACQDILDLYENGTASVARDNVLLSQSAKFPDLDGLEQAGKQKYTILAYSKNQNDAVQSWVCDSTQGEVEWGKTKTVQVTLADRPPLYTGSYEILSRFDFVSAIPEPYRTYVNYVVSFFQSPTQTIITLTCDLLTDPGGQLNSFCDLLYDNGPNGQLVPSALNGFVSQLLDAVIQSLLRNTVFSKIFQVGGDVADILKQFEIRATLTFKKEPDETGRFADGDTSENWHTVKVKWTLGANCDPNTEAGCGVRQFSVNAFQQQAVTGKFPASVANFFDLTIGQHPLNLRYGALINYFMEAFLVPLVIGNPLVNSYEELLGYLVGGGADCLNPPLGTLDCCGRFSDGVGNGDGDAQDGVEPAVNAACTTIQTAAPTFLRNALINLDLSSGETFNLGTKVACKLADTNDDMIIDQIGTQANPCLWNVVLKFSSSAQTTIDSVFWGNRSE